ESRIQEILNLSREEETADPLYPDNGWTDEEWITWHEGQQEIMFARALEISGQHQESIDLYMRNCSPQAGRVLSAYSNALGYCNSLRIKQLELEADGKIITRNIAREQRSINELKLKNTNDPTERTALEQEIS